MLLLQNLMLMKRYNQILTLIEAYEIFFQDLDLSEAILRQIKGACIILKKDELHWNDIYAGIKELLKAEIIFLQIGCEKG